MVAMIPRFVVKENSLSVLRNLETGILELGLMAWSMMYTEINTAPSIALRSAKNCCWLAELSQIELRLVVQGRTKIAAY